jgi:hypothetical protein
VKTRHATAAIYSLEYLALPFKLCDMVAVVAVVAVATVVIQRIK